MTLVPPHDFLNVPLVVQCSLYSTLLRRHISSSQLVIVGELWDPVVEYLKVYSVEVNEVVEEVLGQAGHMTVGQAGCVA